MSGAGLVLHPHSLILQLLLSQRMNHANDTIRTRLRPLAADHTGGAPRAIALLPHAVLTPPLIHHCRLLFPPRICRGRQAWPRGKWIEAATRLRFSRSKHFSSSPSLFRSLHQPGGETTRVSVFGSSHVSQMDETAKWGTILWTPLFGNSIQIDEKQQEQDQNWSWRGTIENKKHQTSSWGFAKVEWFVKRKKNISITRLFL